MSKTRNVRARQRRAYEQRFGPSPAIAHRFDRWLLDYEEACQHAAAMLRHLARGFILTTPSKEDA